MPIKKLLKRPPLLFFIFSQFVGLSLLSAQEEKSLEARLEFLQNKTKDYVFLKKEKFHLERKNNFIQELLKSRVFWSEHLQDLAIFTNDYKVWFGQFDFKTTSTISFETPEITSLKIQEDHRLILYGFLMAPHISHLHQYRADLVSSEWWKSHFLPNGINELNYSVQNWQGNRFYHSFLLEMNLQPKIFKPRIAPLELISTTEGELLNLENKKERLLYQIAKEEEKIKEIEQLNSEILQLTRTLAPIDILVPNEKELETLSQIVADISTIMLLPPFSFRPKYKTIVQEQQEGEIRNLIQGIELPLKFEATYEQIGQFLNAIERAPRLISVEEFVIYSSYAKPNPEIKSLNDLPTEPQLLQVRMTLQAYFYDDPVLQKQNRIQSLGLSPDTSSLKKIEKWTPDASRNPFDCYSVIPFEKEKIEKPIIVNKNEEPEKDNVCRYYDLDRRCPLLKNESSDYCPKHFQLAEKIVKQENLLRKGKELLRKIENASLLGDKIILIEYYQELDHVIQHPFYIEWIKIEIEDIRQRFLKIKEKHSEHYSKEILEKVLPLQKKALHSFLKGDYNLSFSESQQLISIIENDVFAENHSEIQSILEEIKILQQKTTVALELLELPVQVTAILWSQKHPNESRAIINQKIFSTEMKLQNGARLVEIRKKEIVFSYKDQTIVVKLKK